VAERAIRAERGQDRRAFSPSETIADLPCLGRRCKKRILESAGGVNMSIDGENLAAEIADLWARHDLKQEAARQSAKRTFVPVGDYIEGVKEGLLGRCECELTPMAGQSTAPTLRAHSPSNHPVHRAI